MGWKWAWEGAGTRLEAWLETAAGKGTGKALDRGLKGAWMELEGGWKGAGKGKGAGKQLDRGLERACTGTGNGAGKGLGKGLGNGLKQGRQSEKST